MTGITDVLKNSQELTKRLFGRNVPDQGSRIPPQPQRPDPRPSIDLKDNNGNELSNEHQTDENFSKMTSDYRWAVLCPVTSRGSDSHDECLKRLENSALSLVNSISPENRNSTKVFFGYDMKDPLYDPKLTKDRIEEQKQKRKEPSPQLGNEAGVEKNNKSTGRTTTAPRRSASCAASRRGCPS